jgi:hypothetical protein
VWDLGEQGWELQDGALGWVLAAWTWEEPASPWASPSQLAARSACRRAEADGSDVDCLWEAVLEPLRLRRKRVPEGSLSTPVT